MLSCAGETSPVEYEDVLLLLLLDLGLPHEGPDVPHTLEQVYQLQPELHKAISLLEGRETVMQPFSQIQNSTVVNPG